MFVIGLYMVGVSQRPWAARSDVEQPIPFSHRVHAGINKIPCQYCHEYARRSANSGVPPVERCVGCHGSALLGGIEPVTRPWTDQSSRRSKFAGIACTRCRILCASFTNPISGLVCSARNVTGRLKPWTESCRCTRSTWVSVWIAIPSAAPRRNVLSATTERGNEMSDGLSRRSFLKLAATASAAAAIPGCEPAARKLIPYVVPDETSFPAFRPSMPPLARSAPPDAEWSRA